MGIYQSSHRLDVSMLLITSLSPYFYLTLFSVLLCTQNNHYSCLETCSWAQNSTERLLRPELRSAGPESKNAVADCA